MSADDPHRPLQQFYVDEHGVNYARYGNGPWHPISPRRSAQVRRWASYVVQVLISPQISQAPGGYPNAVPYHFSPMEYVRLINDHVRRILIVCIYSRLLQVLLSRHRTGRPQLCLRFQLTRRLWSFLTTTTKTFLPPTRFCPVWLVLLLRLGVDDMPTLIPRGKGSKSHRMRLLQRLLLSAKPQPRQPALQSPRRRRAASPGLQITPRRTCSAYSRF